MHTPGKLYVFEGPDGVGKTELSLRFSELLRTQGSSVQLLAFPGRQAGTLGSLVYDLHHDSQRFGISGLSPASVQLLHIAAHIDMITRTILPALQSGTTVVLDRFWWSTFVYGIASGVTRKSLDSMIQLELDAWGDTKPNRLFLVRREAPLRPEPAKLWNKWKELYDDLAAAQSSSQPLSIIDNTNSVESGIELIQQCLAEIEEMPTVRLESQLGLDFQTKSEKPTRPYLISGLEPAKPTRIYDTYWKFAAERQSIFYKRFRGMPPPWTNDEIFGEYKFTNAYRASDRVSQYLIRNVIYRGEQDVEEVFFRILLFKLFNKIETWELLTSHLGELTYREFDFKAYDRVLGNALNCGTRIYSAAYIMPSGSTTFGTTRKHRAHLKLLDQMMKDEVAFRIADKSKMIEAFNIIRSYPMMGDFLAYQYATDINYSIITNHSEMDFVIPGPGAKSGLSKCFSSLGGLSEAEMIRVVTERQSQEFHRLGIDFQTLWGRPLQLIDCQNLFCEVDKYSRVRHPECLGVSQRTRIKQKFKPNFEKICYWYPPKWGLNESIEREMIKMQR